MSVGLSQRASKEDFMRAMGLDPSDARHEGIYRAMRVSLTEVWSRMDMTKVVVVG